MRSRWAPMASTASTTRARTAVPCSTSAARSPHMRADCSPASAASSAPLWRASTATATPSSSVRMWCTRDDTAAVPYRRARTAGAEGEDGAVDVADHVGDGGGQLCELIGGVGAACGRHGREVPARMRELDLGLGREGGVQHGPLHRPKMGRGVGHPSAEVVGAQARLHRRLPKKPVSSPAHSAAKRPPATSGRWFRRGCARTSSTLPAAPAFGSVARRLHARDAREHDRPGAHRARLERHVEHAVEHTPLIRALSRPRAGPGSRRAPSDPGAARARCERRPRPRPRAPRPRRWARRRARARARPRGGPGA